MNAVSKHSISVLLNSDFLRLVNKINYDHGRGPLTVGGPGSLNPLNPLIATPLIGSSSPLLLLLYLMVLSPSCFTFSIDLCFTKGVFIFQVLKKPNLDPNLRINVVIFPKPYKLKRIVSIQIFPYLERTAFVPSHLSGFRANRSTEALLTSIQRLTSSKFLYLFSFMPLGGSQILLKRLEPSYYLKGIIYLRSYLSKRTQITTSGNSRSPPSQFFQNSTHLVWHFPEPPDLSASC